VRNTAMRDTTLVDVIMVASDLPADEIEQIEAFSGHAFDAQDIAVQIITAPGLRWTCYDKDTKEPLVVAGFIPIGVTIWRSFMLVTNKAWAEHGLEVTLHTRRAVKDFMQGRQHARLETLCLASRVKAHDWYKTVGLQYESTLHAYGVNGETAVLYVKTQGSKEN